MNKINWIDKEIELACKNENPNWDRESFDYGCACYQNAGEVAKAAFEIMSKAGHSGFSHSLTINIIKRLLDEMPLTSIKEEDFETKPWYEDEKHKSFHCVRYHSLFKDIYSDGTIKYSDNDRTVTFDLNNPKYGYGGGWGPRIVDEMFPIKLPYYPLNNKYKVYVETALHDKVLGDYDLVYIPYLIDPKGEKIILNIYKRTKVVGWYRYDDSELIYAIESEWFNISEKEYKKLKSQQLESRPKSEDKIEIRKSPFPKTCDCCKDGSC